MRCLEHGGKPRTILLTLASAHDVLKGMDQLPTSPLNKGQNFRALIAQLLAFRTNSQIVSDTQLTFNDHNTLPLCYIIGAGDISLRKLSSKRTDIYDGLTPSFISRKMALFLDTLLYDTLGLRWLSDR